MCCYQNNETYSRYSDGLCLWSPSLAYVTLLWSIIHSCYRTRQFLVYFHNHNHFHFSLSFSLNASPPPRPMNYWLYLLDILLRGCPSTRYLAEPGFPFLFQTEVLLYQVGTIPIKLCFLACINIVHSLYYLYSGCVGTYITEAQVSFLTFFLVFSWELPGTTLALVPLS